MLGAGLAILSAITFGLNNAAARRGVLSGSVLQGLVVTVPLGVPLFALLCLPIGGFAVLREFSAPAWAWMAAAGIVHFIIGRYGNYRATRALGATLSGPLQQTSILVALVLAMILLDERLTPLKLAGIALVVLGPTVMTRGLNKPGGMRAKSGFTPDYMEGSAWSMVCAVAYGTSPLLIRFGLEGSHGMVGSIAGGLVSYVAATLVLGLIALLPGNPAHVKTLDRTTARWFAISGVFVFLSQVFRYMALAVAPVSVVVPVQRLSMAFRAIFSWMLNRDHEVFGFWALFGIALSLFGALALTVSTEFVLELIPLPPAIADLARWQWP